MPYATVSLADSLVKRIAGRSPFPTGFLAHQNEAGSTRPRRLSEGCRNKLTPSRQRIDETSYRLGQSAALTGLSP